MVPPNMTFFVLDKTFNVVDIIDAFESVIWTEKYSEYGDFEFYVRASMENINRFPIGFYLYYPDSNSTMVINKVEIKSDPENGDHIIVSGNSLEWLLSKRVIPKKVTYTGDIQNTIQIILNENIINPSEKRRKIDNFIFEKANLPDTKPASSEGYTFDGNTVYDAIQQITESKKYGFYLRLKTKDNWKTSYLEFKIINGSDRSYSQDKNPYVIFSSKYGNLLTSDTKIDQDGVYNAAYIGGPEQTLQNGQTKRLVKYIPNKVGSTGWDYYETFYDANNVKTTDDNGHDLPDSAVLNALNNEGNQNIKMVKSGITFDADIMTTNDMVYNKNYFIGDIVQFANSYGMEYPARIIEYTKNWDESGYSEYPKLDTIIEKYQSINDHEGLPVNDTIGNTLQSSLKV